MKVPRLKGDARYTDAPRYKLVYEYEGRMKIAHDKVVKSIVSNFGSVMKNALNIK